MFGRRFRGFSSRFVAVGGAGLLSLVSLSYACGNDNTAPPTSTSVGGSGASGSSNGGGGGTGECVGPKVGSEAYDAEPGPVIDLGGAGGTAGAGGAAAGGAGGTVMALGPKEVGSNAPVYQLEDVHPLSCGYGAVYGLEPFKGKVTIAALWAGW